MAKIRNVFIRCDLGDIKKSFEVTISYSAKEKRFEIILPVELKSVAITFEHQPLHEMGIRYIQKFSGNLMDNVYYVIGDTEDSVQAKAIEVFTKLNSLQVKRRQVIVVDITEYDGKHYRDRYNAETPAIGINLGLLYCTETRAGDNGKPNYTITKNYSGISGDEFSQIHTKEISSSSVIIDDTPENRAFLENTYALLDKLITNLSNHCKTPETLLSLITSNQKLIS